MYRTVSMALLAGLLATLIAGVADAGTITYTTTPFSGTDTDYTNTSVGSQSLPYTDSYGTTVSTSGIFDGINSLGLGFIMFPSTTDTLTWTLASSVNTVGFAFGSGGGVGDTLVSVTLGGDTSTAYNGNTVQTPFMGFSDTTSFNTVSLTFTGTFLYTAILTDFIFEANAVSAVPEPSSLVTMAIAVATGLGALTYRRVRRVPARA